jgi:Ras-related protein Rab-32
MLKQLSVEGKVYKLQLWDIAGQDRFGAVARVYYKDSVGAVLVYDATRPDSLLDVAALKKELDSKVTMPDGGPLATVLMANKSDVEGIVINKAEINKFVLENVNT